MSERLTEDELRQFETWAEHAREKGQPWTGRGMALAIAELRRLRAVVGAHPTGPDQDEPAAQLAAARDLIAGTEYVIVNDADLADAVSIGRPGPERIALLRNLRADRQATPARAREAQATAPRADEDGSVQALAEALMPTVCYSTATHRGALAEEVAAAVHAAGWCPPAAAPGAETTTRPSGWVELVRDHVGEDDEDTHDGPAVVEPPC